MPNKCSIIICGATLSANRPNLTFHRLPQNKYKKRIWLEVIGKEHLRSDLKHIYICSLHFDENSFNRTLDVLRLKDDAVPSLFKQVSWQDTHKGETVVSAIVRLDDEIVKSEKPQPIARLAVVTAEMESIQQEINTFEETTRPVITQETYAKTIHQLFVSLDLYRRPLLASENEDFVANVNRKEMRRLELCWLRTRQNELQSERRILHAQILRTRSLYAQLQQLMETIWGTSTRPGTPLEGELSRARGLRDALSSVSARLRAAAEYAHAAVRLLDDALPAWKMTTIGKSGWERTSACADACRLLVQARCLERGARRVLAAPAAPRAARTLRLALDYAFTDALHDHKYQRATEIFLQFKEALVQLIDSIHKVLLNNLENLSVAEADVLKYQKELRATRVNAVVQKGLGDLKYEPKALTNLKTQVK